MTRASGVSTIVTFMRNKMKLACATAAAVLLLAGCSAGPDVSKATAACQAAFIQVSTDAAEAIGRDVDPDSTVSDADSFCAKQHQKNGDAEFVKDWSDKAYVSNFIAKAEAGLSSGQ